MKREVIYRRGWRAIPLLLKGEYKSLSRPALDLYLTLAFEAAGFARMVTFGNVELMRLSGLTREKTFRKARQELKDRGLLAVYQADKAGRTYDYELLDAKPVTKPLPVGDAIIAIPREKLFR
jgi:hypothetical protein